MTLYDQARTTVFALVSAGGLSFPAAAEEIKFMAELSGQAQIPPVETEATGTADVTVDTEAMTVTWKVTHQGLSGKPVAGHFHGPATAEETAPPVIDMGEGAHGATADAEGTDTEIVEGTDVAKTEGTAEALAQDLLEGSAQLTGDQLADLQAGRYYINLHTELHPDGEVRGQLVAGEADLGAVQGEAGGDPAAAATASVDLVAGEELFKSACRSCHGPKAQGMASFPKLAGRDAAYLMGRLDQYHAGETVGPNSKLMIPVAQKLSADDRANVAGYIAETFQ